MKVIVADKMSWRRDGVRACMREHFPNATIVAELDHGRDLLNLTERVRPNLVITEVGLPGVNLVTLVRRIIGQSLAKVVCQVDRHEMAYVPLLVQAGAGCVLCDEPSAELVRLLSEYLASDSGRLGEAVTGSVGPVLLEQLKQLTRRQMEVYQLKMVGLNVKEISSRLGISKRTAETHLYAMGKILGAEVAQRLGIVSNRPTRQTKRKRSSTYKLSVVT